MNNSLEGGCACGALRYMMRMNLKAFHPAAHDFSMRRALAILDGLTREQQTSKERTRES